MQKIKIAFKLLDDFDNLCFFFFTLKIGNYFGFFWGGFFIVYIDLANFIKFSGKISKICYITQLVFGCRGEVVVRVCPLEGGAPQAIREPQRKLMSKGQTSP